MKGFKRVMSKMKDAVTTRAEVEEAALVTSEYKRSEDTRGHLKILTKRVEKRQKLMLAYATEVKREADALIDFAGTSETNDAADLSYGVRTLARAMERTSTLLSNLHTAMQTEVQIVWTTLLSDDLTRTRQSKARYDRVKDQYALANTKADRLLKKARSGEELSPEEKQVIEDRTVARSTYEVIETETVAQLLQANRVCQVRGLKGSVLSLNHMEEFFMKGAKMMEMMQKQINKVRESADRAEAELEERGSKDHTMFGIHPLVLKSRDGQLPAFLWQCMDRIRALGFGEEGIFRKSGNTTDLALMRKKIDQGMHIDISGEPSVHNVTGLLKLWLRALPEPLLTWEVYDACAQAFEAHEKDPPVFKEKIRAAFDTVNPACFHLFTDLMRLFHDSLEQASTNLMSPKAIATVIAPTLMYPKDENPAVQLVAAKVANAVIQLVIEDMAMFFPEDTLHSCASRQDMEGMRVLLDDGCDVDTVNEDGCTALHVCVENAYDEGIALLLEKGCDVNAEDGRGWTPIYTALRAGHQDVAVALAESGAELKVQPSGESSMWSVASGLGGSCVKRLQAAAAALKQAKKEEAEAEAVAKEAAGAPSSDSGNDGADGEGGGSSVAHKGSLKESSDTVVEPNADDNGDANPTMSGTDKEDAAVAAADEALQLLQTPKPPGRVALSSSVTMAKSFDLDASVDGLNLSAASPTSTPQPERALPTEAHVEPGVFRLPVPEDPSLEALPEAVVSLVASLGDPSFGHNKSSLAGALKTVATALATLFRNLDPIGASLNDRASAAAVMKESSALKRACRELIAAVRELNALEASDAGFESSRSRVRVQAAAFVDASYSVMAAIEAGMDRRMQTRMKATGAAIAVYVENIRSLDRSGQAARATDIYDRGNAAATDCCQRALKCLYGKNVNALISMCDNISLAVENFGDDDIARQSAQSNARRILLEFRRFRSCLARDAQDLSDERYLEPQIYEQALMYLSELQMKGVANGVIQSELVVAVEELTLAMQEAKGNVGTSWVKFCIASWPSILGALIKLVEVSHHVTRKVATASLSDTDGSLGMARQRNRVQWLVQALMHHLRRCKLAIAANALGALSADNTVERSVAVSLRSCVNILSLLVPQLRSTYACAWLHLDASVVWIEVKLDMFTHIDSWSDAVHALARALRGLEAAQADCGPPRGAEYRLAWARNTHDDTVDDARCAISAPMLLAACVHTSGVLLRQEVFQCIVAILSRPGGHGHHHIDNASAWDGPVLCISSNMTQPLRVYWLPPREQPRLVDTIAAACEGSDAPTSACPSIKQFTHVSHVFVVCGTQGNHDGHVLGAVQVGAGSSGVVQHARVTSDGCVRADTGCCVPPTSIIVPQYVTPPTTTASPNQPIRSTLCSAPPSTCHGCQRTTAAILCRQRAMPWLAMCASRHVASIGSHEGSASSPSSVHSHCLAWMCHRCFVESVRNPSNAWDDDGSDVPEAPEELSHGGQQGDGDPHDHVGAISCSDDDGADGSSLGSSSPSTPSAALGHRWIRTVAPSLLWFLPTPVWRRVLSHLRPRQRASMASVHSRFAQVVTEVCTSRHWSRMCDVCEIGPPLHGPRWTCVHPSCDGWDACDACRWRGSADVCPRGHGLLAVLSNSYARAPNVATHQYVPLSIEGWTVRVRKVLLPRYGDGDASVALHHHHHHHDDVAGEDLVTVGSQAVRLMRHQLYGICRVLPMAAVRRLQRVTLWLGVDDGAAPCAEYHGCAQWLAEHGYNVDKVRCVEIGNAQRFLQWSLAQPCMVLHELAHAFHDQVLGTEHALIHQAYEEARASGAYARVMRGNGSCAKAYAITDPAEYFAECSEAYWGVNNWYPFNRAELRRHDPFMCDVVRRVWTDERLWKKNA